jgi:predicted esterase/tetratricopeptide (TPR) repeat protein
MIRAMRLRRGLQWAAVALGVVTSLVATSHAARLALKDGRIIEGNIAQLLTISNKPQKPKSDGAPAPKLILLCDDGLRRTYFCKYMLTPDGLLEGNTSEPPERFILKNQSVAEAGSRITAVGPMRRISPFDEWGRRTIEMSTEKRNVTIFQGITEITPNWTRVQGLHLPDSTAYVWDQRLATTTLPPELLAKILERQINPKNIDQRLKIVRLYLQMERYQEAQQELTQVIKDFPEHADQFARTERELAQRSAQRMFNEIQLRRAAGQHQFAMHWLTNFPHEGVAGEILQKVKQNLEGYQAEFARGTRVMAKIDEYLAAVQDTKQREKLRQARDEIVAELNLNTIDRMTAFEQSIDDEATPSDEKLALAISGWLMGSNQALRKLPVAASLFSTRDKVRKYLEESIKPKRDEILRSLDAEEGSTVEYVTHLVANMLPTRETPEPDAEAPGFYEISVDGVDDRQPVTYYVQLPPEYDPHRLYPTVVTLNGSGSTAKQQVDWWAGSPTPGGGRAGQAGRYGYIVIAPVWAKEQQTAYTYTLDEHMAVLHTLRDACRHFAIDTDRVFLSGHSMGGDAAWDIGLAHPDMWAGVIPIVASADRYVKHYWNEGKIVPLYVIEGEMDGDRIARNAEFFDKCLTTSGMNFTLVEFQGRGHEHFSDEILRIFDWMGRLKRDFARKTFAGYTMRSWDNFFWWVEIADLPPKMLVDPLDWPLPSGSRAAETTANVNANNGIHVKTPADRVTIWLSPEVVDFKRKITLNVNARTIKTAPDIEPSLSVLLEDVRTRVARLHPFWAKIQTPGGRVNVADAGGPPVRGAAQRGGKK